MVKKKCNQKNCENGVNYKNSVDKKRDTYGRNKDVLIVKLKECGLLSDRYLKKKQKQILAEFSENEKNEKGSERYVFIVNKLEEIENKKRDLEDKKEKLRELEEQRKEIRKRIIENDVDNNIKTLDEQELKLKKFGVDLARVNQEIEELKKDISSLEKEIGEMEMVYGKSEKNVDENVIEEPVVGEGEKDDEGNIRDENLGFMQYHAIKSKILGKKEKVVGEIIRLLGESGISDGLEEELKEVVLDKLSGYKSKNGNTLGIKIAEKLKEILDREGMDYEAIKKMPEGPEKNKLLQKLRIVQKLYGIESSEEKEALEKRKYIDGEIQKYRQTRRSAVCYEYDRWIVEQLEERIKKIIVRLRVRYKEYGMAEFRLGNKLYTFLDKNKFSEEEYSLGGVGLHEVFIHGPEMNDLYQRLLDITNREGENLDMGRRILEYLVGWHVSEYGFSDISNVMINVVDDN